jgi:hypothetical protein
VHTLSPHALALLLVLGGMTALWILFSLACRIRDEIALHDLRLRSLSLRDRLELERLRAEGLASVAQTPDDELGAVDILDDDGQVTPDGSDQQPIEMGQAVPDEPAAAAA